MILVHFSRRQSWKTLDLEQAAVKSDGRALGPRSGLHRSILSSRCQKTLVFPHVSHAFFHEIRCLLKVYMRSIRSVSRVLGPGAPAARLQRFAGARAGGEAPRRGDPPGGARALCGRGAAALQRLAGPGGAVAGGAGAGQGRGVAAREGVRY